MIYQTDKFFPDWFARYGCYYMALQHLFGGGCNISDEAEAEIRRDRILRDYRALVGMGYIGHRGKIGVGNWYRCYILDPAAVASVLDVEGGRYAVSWRRSNDPPPDAALIGCYHTSVGYHFAAYQSIDGHVDPYNPDPTISVDNPCSWRAISRV